mgnify:CR=1 FL=1
MLYDIKAGTSQDGIYGIVTARVKGESVPEYVEEFLSRGWPDLTITQYEGIFDTELKIDFDGYFGKKGS